MNRLLMNMAALGSLCSLAGADNLKTVTKALALPMMRPDKVTPAPPQKDPFEKWRIEILGNHQNYQVSIQTPETCAISVAVTGKEHLRDDADIQRDYGAALKKYCGDPQEQSFGTRISFIVFVSLETDHYYIEAAHLPLDFYFSVDGKPRVKPITAKQGRVDLRNGSWMTYWLVTFDNMDGLRPLITAETKTITFSAGSALRQFAACYDLQPPKKASR